MTASSELLASAAASAIAGRLTEIDPVLPGQSLARGAAGVGLLHAERAKAGLGDWHIAHSWLARAAAGEVDGSTRSSLFFGVPAVAFAVAAAADESGRYSSALAELDRGVAAVAMRRVQRAHQRIDSGQQPALSEFDVISGLAGIGAYLLRRPSCEDELRGVLSYLVRLTEPVHGDHSQLPGWWARTGPDGRMSAALPGGHGNLGISHGICGPLALLALAMRAGVTVPGHSTAIATICAWLDGWRQGGSGSAWWPEWVTRDEERDHRTARTRSARPSWCYGTPGITRALQLAGLATGDVARARLAEQELAACVQDPAQVGALDGASLCHGLAGLVQVTLRASADSPGSPLAASLPGLLGKLTGHHGLLSDDHQMPRTARQSAGRRLGLLEGAAGTALALHAATGEITATAWWDGCLLIA